jgi:protein associated with RNAse G/E
MNEPDLQISRDILWKWHDAAEGLRHIAQLQYNEELAELAEALRQEIDNFLLHDGRITQKQQNQGKTHE